MVEEYLLDDPVVLLEGPRSVGKSTLLRQVAAAHGAPFVDLDDPRVRQQVKTDPALFVQGSCLVCIDEYQKEPIILDAIKAELNIDGRAGRFVLAGSTRHEALPTTAQALTGRLSRLPVFPFSVSEIAPNGSDHLAAILHDPEGFTLSRDPSTMTRHEYIDRILMGGFPAPLAKKSIGARHRWLDDYVRLTLERDVRELRRLNQKSNLRLLFQRLAGQTAQLLVIERLARLAELDRATTQAHLELLETVFLLHRLPAWGTTLNSKVGRAPKIHILDSAIAARLMGLSAGKLALQNPAALSQFGHLLETFVVNEILKQASWLPQRVLPGHWRTHDNAEVDLILELDDGQIVAFEIKAAGRVPDTDFKSLRKLQALAGDAFLAGFVLYLGSHSYRVGNDLFVIPVDKLWSGPLSIKNTTAGGL